MWLSALWILSELCICLLEKCYFLSSLLFLTQDASGYGANYYCYYYLINQAHNKRIAVVTEPIPVPMTLK